jgi:pimeloyl-ACP methyl ester carboxylesterase
MATPDVPHEPRRIRTGDGVDLAVQVAGEGPPVVLANGIGVRHPGWSRFVEHLRRRHRVICWDYRGIGGSETDARKAGFAMSRHAWDALEVLDALGEDRAAVVGWSMGVPVALEMIRAAPKRITHFGALFGAPGRPFHAGFPMPVAAAVAGVAAFSARVSRPANLVLGLATTFPRLAHAALAVPRFTGWDADKEIFAADVASVAGAPKDAYFRTMVALARHDASDLLARIACPTLVIGGGRDWLTPPAASQAMADAIPGARLLLLPDATHFGLIEQPEAVLAAVDGLLAQSPERR